jgi:hypothetical protein
LLAKNVEIELDGLLSVSDRFGKSIPNAMTPGKRRDIYDVGAVFRSNQDGIASHSGRPSPIWRVVSGKLEIGGEHTPSPESRNHVGEGGYSPVTGLFLPFKDQCEIADPALSLGAQNLHHDIVL